MPRKAETYTVKPVVAAEAVSCVNLLDRGVGCAMGVAAARASAEPVPLSMDMAKKKRKRCRRQAIRPAAGTAFGSGDEGRNTSDEPPRVSRNAVNPFTWLVCAKFVKCVR